MAGDITVPLLDLKAQYATLRDEVEGVIRDVVESQWFILGPEVQGLESEIATYCNTRHALGNASGSDAILLALMAIGVGPGDDVIVPTYTFFSTASTVSRLGARPVFADIDPVTYNVDVETVRDAVGRCRSLKAIMPVHLFGQAVDMDGMLALGDELGVPIIEDAAQAIGARDATGTVVGSRGAIGAFSFFPSKNLGAFGDGGICTTNDDELAHAMQILRNHGGEPKYHHAVIGINSRLDALQAAVLRVKLRHLDAWTGGRRANAAHYDAMFAAAGAHDSRRPLDDDGLPIRTPAPAAAPAWQIYNQYVIRVPADIRDDVRAGLGERNVGTEIYYPIPLHLQQCFADLGYAVGDLPVAEAVARETIALPIYAELTAEQREHVAQAVIELVGARAAAGGVVVR